LEPFRQFLRLQSRAYQDFSDSLGRDVLGSSLTQAEAAPAGVSFGSCGLLISYGWAY
jgi:hypothetical protein